MSSALEISAVGLRAQQQALDTIASNVANMNTPAYKRSELRFSELVAGPQVDRSANPTASDPIAGVSQSSMMMLDKQGQLQTTGNPLDLAIDGGGFLELMGPAGKTLLWRGGTLKVTDNGALATSSGIPLKAGISVPSDATAIRIDRQGKVFATTADNGGESEIGEIALVRISDPQQVERLDGGVYAVRDDVRVVEAAAGEEGLGYFVQGAIEQSNVDLNSEMVNLIIAQRAYGASAQVIRAADELLTMANNLRRS